MNNLIICNSIPEYSVGASSSVYFKYIESLLKISDNLEILIVDDKIKNINDRIENLKTELSSPNNLNVKHLKSNTKLSYLPWESNFFIYRFFRRRISIEEKFDNLICFDIETGFLNIDCKANSKILWLGDLHFELEWFNYIESNNHSFYNSLKMYFLFLNKLISYKIINNKFNKIICCSMSAQIRLNKIGVKAVFKPFPYPSLKRTSLHKFSEVKEKKFLFYGNLIGSGSQSGLKFLFNEILPAARKIWGVNNFQIIIGGRTKLPETYNTYFQSYPELSYVGYIKDLKETLSMFTALLIPISLPLGNRTRVLDGLSFGIPVVGHVSLNKGNPFLLNGVNCLLASNGLEFINMLNKLCEDNVLYDSIINNGIKTYELTYDPNLNHAIQLIN